MKYAKIKPNDIANGQGVVVSLWVQGCPHRCKGCHNPETWDFNGGKDFGGSEVIKILSYLDKGRVKRDFSILGGEPLAPRNRAGVIALCKLIKKKRPETKIYLWTGYTFEELMEEEYVRDSIGVIDVLIDGRFIERYKNLSLPMRGSANQRVIDVKKTLKENKIILY